VTALRRLGKRVVFLTNNPTRDAAMYAEKLTRLGLPTAADEIITTVFTTTHWLAQHRPGAVVFAIGEEPLQRALQQAGIRTSEDPAEIDVVVVSYDRSFDYRKMKIAFDALWYYKRAIMICTNPDHFCPLPGGRGEPDAGAIVAALEDATGVKLAVNCGKPSPGMLDVLLNVMGLEAAQCLITGDRLYTEIQMGLEAGMDTAVVFTGETTPEMLAHTLPEKQPTYALERIDALLPETVWAKLEASG
jgi:HAD superfamily hydrolase (TIGR01450 family)